MTTNDNVPPRPAQPPQLRADHEESVPPPPRGGTGIVPPPRAGRHRRWWWAVAAGAVAIVLIVAGIWWGTRGASSPTALPETRPELLYTVHNDPSLHRSGAVRVAGTPDDFAVGATGYDGLEVTRYVKGEADWTSSVETDESFALKGLVDVGNIVMVHAGYGDESAVIGFDRQTGKTIWSLDTAAESGPRVVAGRYFLVTASGDIELTASGRRAGTGTVIEFDPETGKELNSFSGDTLTEVEAGWVSLDVNQKTAQLIDFDLKPVGEPVRMETDLDPLVQRDEQGWIYYQPRYADGGGAFVGVGLDGDGDFECVVTDDDATFGYRWRHVYRVDDHTFTAVGDHAARGFSVEGSQCSTVWDLPHQEDTAFTIDGANLLMARTPDGYANEYDPENTVQLIDWQTGEAITSGMFQLIVDGDGRALSHEGPSIVVRDIGSGKTLWSLDAAVDSHVIRTGPMIAVVTTEPDYVTIDVYAG